MKVSVILPRGCAAAIAPANTRHGSLLLVVDCPDQQDALTRLRDSLLVGAEQVRRELTAEVTGDPEIRCNGCGSFLGLGGTAPDRCQWCPEVKS